MIVLTFGPSGYQTAVEGTQRIWSDFASELGNSADIQLQGVKVRGLEEFELVDHPDKLAPCPGVIDRDVAPFLSLQLIDPDLLADDGYGEIEWQPGIYPGDWAIREVRRFIIPAGGCGIMERFINAHPWARIGNAQMPTKAVKFQREDSNINGLTFPSMLEEFETDVRRVLDNLHTLITTKFEPNEKERKFIEARIKAMSRGQGWSLRKWGLHYPYLHPGR